MLAGVIMPRVLRGGGTMLTTMFVVTRGGQVEREEVDRTKPPFWGATSTRFRSDKILHRLRFVDQSGPAPDQS